MADHKLGELLVAGGVLGIEQIDGLLERQKHDCRRLGQILIDDGLVEEEMIREVLGRQLGTPVVDLSTVEIDPTALDLLPAQVVQNTEVVPLRLEGRVLHVAAVDPANTLALDEVRLASGFSELAVALTTATDFGRFVEEAYHVRPALTDALAGGEEAPLAIMADRTAPSGEATNLEAEAEPVVRLADFVLGEAIRRDATHVSVEPFPTVTRIRMRVDGALQNVLTLPRRLHSALWRRFFVLSGADEDGAQGTLRVTTGHAAAGFTVNGVESTEGTLIMLRRQDVLVRQLSELGLAGQNHLRLQRLLDTPQGLVLVAGPRHSGRTSTALALARSANRASRMVSFVGAGGGTPIPGVVSLGDHAAGPAARAAKALSTDPDVLVLDLPGATSLPAIAADAGLNGHLVIATHNGSRALPAIGQLIDQGVPAWVVAASLRAVVAQRLVRANCAKCAAATTPDPADLEEFGIPAHAAQKARFSRGAGCSECFGTGYRGLELVSELVFVNGPLQQAILDGVGLEQMTELAREHGFHSMWENAIVKVLRGRTTFAEVRAALAPPA